MELGVFFWRAASQRFATNLSLYMRWVETGEAIELLKPHLADMTNCSACAERQAGKQQ
jgi:hypothetical protein